MRIFHGDMWNYSKKFSENQFLMVVTTNGIVKDVFVPNSTIKNKPELVMGKGAAKQAVERYPGLARQAGAKVIGFGKCLNSETGLWLYGFLPITNHIGIFQVKYCYSLNARLSLIGYSVTMLNAYLSYKESWFHIIMNFPGIGFGGLTKEEVFPIIAELDDRVTVCEEK